MMRMLTLREANLLGGITRDVVDEVSRQCELFASPPHHDISPDTHHTAPTAAHGLPSALEAKVRVERAGRVTGGLSWAHLVVEELCEAVEAAAEEKAAVAAGDAEGIKQAAEHTDEEIVQVAALCFSWLLNRRSRR